VIKIKTAPVADAKKPAASPVTPGTVRKEKAPAAEAAEPVKPSAVADPKPEMPSGKPESKGPSRIPSEAAKPAAVLKTAAPTATPKTIRIKPAAPVSAAGKPAMGERPAVPEARKGPGLEGKRKTSRIPLEKVLSPEEQDSGKSDEGVPKTIRLKRPSVAPTAGVPKRAESADAKAKAPAEEEKPASGKTARLDAQLAEAESPTATRRKTIRVKRPTQKPAAEGISVARAPEAGKPARKEEGAEAVGAVDEPGLVFSILTIAATLLACVAIYVLAAQAIGPNVSLTRLSYNVRGPNLAWPGKITLSQ